MLVSNNQSANAADSSDIFSTASSLLWTLLARASGRRFDRKLLPKSRAYNLETSMSRIPISKKDTVSKRTNQEQLEDFYDVNSKSIPQAIVPESMPVVHGRLPDLSLWNKIDEKLKGQEKTNQASIPSWKLKKTAVFNKLTFKGKVASKTKSLLSRKRRSLPTHPELEGVLRRRQLYCRTGYHIQILSNGRVTGTSKDHDKNAILEFISIDVGLITIRGVDSGKYLSMDSKGRLYGSNRVSRESIFRETMQENWYNTYSSTRYRNHSNRRPCYIAINRNGRAKQGCRNNANQRFTHFLPRPVDPEKVPYLYKGILY